MELSGTRPLVGDTGPDYCDGGPTELERVHTRNLTCFPGKSDARTRNSRAKKRLEISSSQLFMSQDVKSPCSYVPIPRFETIFHPSASTSNKTNIFVIFLKNKTTINVVSNKKEPPLIKPVRTTVETGTRETFFSVPKQQQCRVSESSSEQATRREIMGVPRCERMHRHTGDELRQDGFHFQEPKMPVLGQRQESHRRRVASRSDFYW